MFKERALSWFIFIAYRVLMMTWRVRLFECEQLLDDKKNKRPIICANWHGDDLTMVQLASYFKASTMTSTSKDGNLIDFVINKLGAKTSRGSSTRGGVTALKGLVRLCKAGHPSFITVDGPTGPLHKVKPGIFQLSVLAKAKIYPAGIYCESKIDFPKSWDKAYLPKPFAKIAIYFDDPLPAVIKSNREEFAKLSKTLENQLHNAKQKAAKLIAKPKTQMLP